MGCEDAVRSVDEIIEKNANAMGGPTAIEAVRSIRINLHIVDPTFEVEAVYRAARPGRMRIDVSAGGKHVFTEAFNGERGWQWKGKGEPVLANPQATATLRYGVELPRNLFGLHELRQRGHQIALIGQEKIVGVNCYVLRITLKDGYGTSVYVDPDSWLITRRRDVRALHPDIDPKPTTIESVKTDFRKVGGVYFSFQNADKDLATGKVLEAATITGIIINPDLDGSIFEQL